MHSKPMARILIASAAMAAIGAAASLGAQSSIPTRKLVLQVNLNANDQYYLDTFKADVERKESGMGPGKKASSRDKLQIILDTVDLLLFRQYCDSQGIRVSDAEVSNQLAQYKASLGPGATDATVENSLRRGGVFTDVKAYVKNDLLFGSYLKKSYPNDIASISQPSSADILKAYDDMKFNLRRPSLYRFSMLLIPTQGKSDTEKKRAEDAMRAIAAKLKGDPSAYDEYFVKGVVDSKAAGYQTMPYVVIAKTAESRSQFPNLYDQVFKLKEGDVSDVIEDNMGFCVVRVSQYLPEKQLGLDDFIEGLNVKSASANPSATVMALVVNAYQNGKYNEVAQKARSEVSVKTRKDGRITIYVSNLVGELDDSEIATLKALANKGSGYSAEIR